MRKWWRRVYGQYKLIKATCYIHEKVREAMRREEWKQMQDLLDAGEILLDARDSLSS